MEANMEVTLSSSTDHLIFRNNPLQLKSFINKYTEITTIDGNRLQGKIYTIDPVSQSIVLISHTEEHASSEGSLSLDIIMGHALKSIDIIKPPDNSKEVPDDLFDSNWKGQFSEDDIVRRRQTVKDLLCKNRIPVEEDGEVLRLANALEILPPYDVKSCSSLDSNEIILGRVQDLLSSIGVCTTTHPSDSETVF